MEKTLEKAFAAFREAPEDERAAIGDFIRETLHAEPRSGPPGEAPTATRIEPPVETPVRAPVRTAGAGPVDPAADRAVLVLRVEDMCAPPVCAPPRIGDWAEDWLADWAGYGAGDAKRAEARSEDDAGDSGDRREERPPETGASSVDPAPDARPAPDAPRRAAPERRLAASDGAEIVDIFGAGASQGDFRRLFSGAR